MSTPKRKPRKTQESSITISEFKQWLAGVEDMQEDGWVPDAVQWAKIRAKVELLAEDEISQAPVEQYQHVPAYQPYPNYPIAQPQDYSSLASQGPQQYRGQSSLLEGDGIMIPQKTQFDVQHDQPGMGPQHDPNSFA